MSRKVAPISDEERRRFAFHEAAHAVVASAMGMLILGITLQTPSKRVRGAYTDLGPWRTRMFRKQGDGFRLTPKSVLRRQLLEKMTCVSLVGWIMDGLGSGRDLQGSEKDFFHVDQYVRELDLEPNEANCLVSRANRRVTRILLRRGDALKRVAEAFIESGVLTAEQVKRLLRKPRKARAKRAAAKRNKVQG